jgi:hypothetical protein
MVSITSQDVYVPTSFDYLNNKLGARVPIAIIKQTRSLYNPAQCSNFSLDIKATVEKCLVIIETFETQLTT